MSRAALSSRLIMRRVDRLRLRRVALTKVDRQPDHRGDRQELTLPVLERLEPESRRQQVVGEYGLFVPVLNLIVGELRIAAERVADPRGKEQRDERESKRVLVEREDPAAAPHRPGRVRIVSKVPRI